MVAVLDEIPEELLNKVVSQMSAVGGQLGAAADDVWLNPHRFTSVATFPRRQITGNVVLPPKSDFRRNTIKWFCWTYFLTFNLIMLANAGHCKIWDVSTKELNLTKEVGLCYVKRCAALLAIYAFSLTKIYPFKKSSSVIQLSNLVYYSALSRYLYLLLRPDAPAQAVDHPIVDIEEGRQEVESMPDNGIDSLFFNDEDRSLVQKIYSIDDKIGSNSLFEQYQYVFAEMLKSGTCLMLFNAASLTRYAIFPSEFSHHAEHLSLTVSRVTMALSHQAYRTFLLLTMENQQYASTALPVFFSQQILGVLMRSTDRTTLVSKFSDLVALHKIFRSMADIHSLRLTSRGVRDQIDMALGFSRFFMPPHALQGTSVDPSLSNNDTHAKKNN